MQACQLSQSQLCQCIHAQSQPHCNVRPLEVTMRTPLAPGTSSFGMSGVNAHMLLCTCDPEPHAITSLPALVWEPSRAWPGPFLLRFANPMAFGSNASSARSAVCFYSAPPLVYAPAAPYFGTDQSPSGCPSAWRAGWRRT